MSDNLCGPSAPTKGLVGHLDRDRTLQQDRINAGSPASATGSFRSTTRETPSTASGDAAFANFTSAPPQQPNAAASKQAHVAPKMNPNHNPLLGRQYWRRNTGQVQIPLNNGPDKFDLENHVNQPIPARRGGLDHQRPSAALAAVNTSWVNDFNRRQDEEALRVQMEALRLQEQRNLPIPQTGPYAAMRPIPNNTLAYGPSYGQPVFAAQGGYHYPSAQPMLYGNGNPYGPSHMMQGGQYLASGHPLQQDNVAPHDHSALSTAQTGSNGLPFSHYPQNIALAANTEEALGAAFAAYDQDFEGEMDQWVAAHGPEDRQDHEAIMTEHANKLDAEREKGNPKVLSQRDPKNRFYLNKQESYELDVYAKRILITMVESDNEKFKDSSFTELMRRIVNHEVVIEGDDLVDVATGKPTDLTRRDLKPFIQVPDMPPTFIPPSDAELRAKHEADLQAKQEAESKGKEPAVAVSESSGGA
ncbi:hypothetical protein Daus18300_004692 [Diaporthe australafricana]|uniref:Uncharacterized protein n=1 Tax=Diaporthe australafricana TaxID=127596 RepID=A0ABR3X7Q8_9PEZI